MNNTLSINCVFPIFYLRISGGAASDKNIKENVCAQIEKNFARAKWKVSIPVLLSCNVTFIKFNRGCVLLKHGRAVIHHCIPQEHIKSRSAGQSTPLSSARRPLLLQKAVRVTTIMKRLRAPEPSPAAGAPAAGAPAALQGATDPSAPSSSATPEEVPAAVTELPAGAEINQPAPEAGGEVAASPAEPRQPSPAPQEAEPTTRCNGEASAEPHATAEGGEELD